MKRFVLFATYVVIALSAYCDRAGLEELSKDADARYDITQVKIDGLYYNLSSRRKTARVVSVKAGDEKYAGEVRIPGNVDYQGESYGVIMIEKEAFSGCKELTNVYIDDDVLGISYSAFSGCSGLTSIRLPRHLSLINMDAFDGCTSLERVIVPDLTMWCMTHIVGTSLVFGDGPGVAESPLFFGRLYGEDGKEITELVIPDGVTEVNNFTFRGCRSITSVKLPASVEKVGHMAFSECGNLRKAELSGNLKEAGANIFYQCPSLSELILPGTLKTIPQCFCRDCTSLTELTIPEGVEKVGYEAFSGCSSLTTIRIPSTLKTFEYGWGSLNGGRVIIPSIEGWCNIDFGSSAVYNATLYLDENTPICDLRFPDGVKIVPSHAFEGYRGLNSIDFNKVETIEAFAFQESDIESVTIPEPIKEIGMAAFQSCQNLSSVDLPSSIEILAGNAFSYCPSLNLVYYNLMTFPKYGYKTWDYGWMVFEHSPIDKATLYVPEDMIEACKGEEPWSGFGQILPLPTGTETSIQGAECQVEKEKSAMYDLQGRKLNAVPEKGMYIQGGRKVLIK